MIFDMMGEVVGSYCRFCSRAAHGYRAEGTDRRQQLHQSSENSHASLRERKCPVLLTYLF
jgi:hypothetical protein